MNVVSNTSALINLARIGKLDLLHKLYGELIIPEAVWRETVLDGRGQPGSSEVEEAPWIKMDSVTNSQLVQVLEQDLDAGEAEAIALALEKEAALLLMDEHLGRQTARYLGLRFTGLVGVLIEAKHSGVLSAVRPHLNTLRDIAGFRISNALYRSVLQDEREEK